MNLRQLAYAIALVPLLAGPSGAEDVKIPKIGPDELAFSAKNMDASVSPAKDFLRYASGGWLDRVERPADKVSIGALAYQNDLVIAQLKSAAADAAARADGAPKGSPVQQVGTFYKAFLDTKSRDAAGIKPLRERLKRIDAIGSYDDLARYLGEQAAIVGKPPLFFVAPNQDLVDNKVYKIYAGDGEFVLKDSETAVYFDAPGSDRQVAYEAYVRGMLKVAGYKDEQAAAISAKIVSLETELFSGKLTPAETRDFSNYYNPMSLEKMQAQISQLDLKLFLQGMGVPVPKEIVNSQIRYFPKLSEVLGKYSLDDVKHYLAFHQIARYAPVLTTKFDEPRRAFRESLSGSGSLDPIENRGIELLRTNLGQPMSQVFVERFFSEDARKAALDMAARVKKVFLSRIPSRAWLSDAARAEALKKAEAISFTIGWPDKWVDYSSIEIGPDLVTDMENIVRFGTARYLAKSKGPVTRDQMNNPGHTLPMDLNAAYDPQINGFEVSAAIVRPPSLMPEMDAAVNYCRLGAVLGHEITHGFDIGGRAFDAAGNLRNWWTDADTKAFVAEAKKLVDQANGTEVLPGVFANGKANVGENMADVGGITFAHEALMDYLKEHPKEDVKIDGLSPSQRCFISWAQLWTEKAAEPALKNLIATNPHPPNIYRTVAPLQHVDAFYKAFGIKQGDPMWLPPEKRLHAW